MEDTIQAIGVHSRNTVLEKQMNKNAGNQKESGIIWFVIEIRISQIWPFVVTTVRSIFHGGTYRGPSCWETSM